MRYYVKCKLNSQAREKLANSIRLGNLAKGQVFYDGMHAALRGATIDDMDIVHFVEVCYCLEGGLYPMAIKLPGKLLIEKLNLVKDVLQERKIDSRRFLDIGRIVLNRRKQRQGIDALKNIVYECTSSKIKPVIGGAAVSGLFAIFYDGEYFRIKNIPDTNEARQIFDKLGLSISNSVQSVKQNTKQSLAGSHTYSNIV